jgi:DNA/RNA-binding protein KIN17
VYQEYIADKQHIHMNSTRWVTLTEFVKHLGRTGVAHVDENEKGWFIAWIDNSPKALAKQEASMKKERAAMSDEQRERMLIAEQIERANAEADDKGEGKSDSPPADEGLKRDDSQEKVVLSFSAKPKAPSPSDSADTTPSEGSTPAPSTGFKLGAAKPAVANPLKVNPLKANPLKANPLKRSNPLKGGSDADKSNGVKRPASSISAAERLIMEEQERKKRRMEREA